MHISGPPSKPTVSARDQQTVRRILKVNHAGEYGAIRIYRAQLTIARLVYPDTTEFLQSTLTHEVTHCRSFRDAMPRRAARPCRIMGLWGQGGYLLGALTALFGRQGIWICTAAVEATVHRHLEEQLRFLATRDRVLHDVIVEIQKEESVHLDYALVRIRPLRFWSRWLDATIRGATETVIWLSTWGDSARMTTELRQASD